MRETDQVAERLPEPVSASGSSAIAWCAGAAPAEATSGPRRLDVATAPPGPEGTTDLAGPPVAGSELDALLAGSAVLAAADLGLGDVGAGLDAVALRVTRRISPHLDGAWATELGLATESPLLDLVVQDAPVPVLTGPEAAMGAALARALEEGIGPGTIDVSLLRDAAGPLEDLLATLPAWGDGLSPQLTFDTEVLQLARTAWRLLYVTHHAWFAAHNRILGGDARRLLKHPVDAWAAQLADRAAAVVERVHILRSLEGSSDDLAELVKQHFAHSAGEADRQAFATWIDEEINAPVESVLALTDPAATELAVRLERHLPEFEDEVDLADATDAVGAYLEAWLLTDAGLLARLHRELHLASDAWAWRRVACGPRTEWSVVDLPAAAEATATALDVVEMVHGRG